MAQPWTALSAPFCLLMVLCGAIYLLADDPMGALGGVLVGLAVVGYLVFSVFTVIWAINTGEAGVNQQASFQAKLYFWHGVSVVLTVILSAAGSFIVLFARLVWRGFGGGLR
jgi:hypothetical protein